MSLLDGKSLLITGGTGSFGKLFVQTILEQTQVSRVVIFSRDELKQWEMSQLYPDEKRLRFFIGDVRDESRLLRAFDTVDYVVHAAALKQVPAAEYNPFEAVKTNILGAKNVIDAAIDRGVKKVIALSTDKASSPINLYGATKFVSDKLFVNACAYSGSSDTKFANVRFGNMIGSRGSVIPLFIEQAKSGVIPITDPDMTRFWITVQQAVNVVLNSLEMMNGSEIFVHKCPSMKLVDLAKAIAPDAKLKYIGIRPGEKLHEELISQHDAYRTLDVGECYVIMPDMQWFIAGKMKGQPVPKGFSFTSDCNDTWLTTEQILNLIR